MLEEKGRKPGKESQTFGPDPTAGLWGLGRDSWAVFV